MRFAEFASKIKKYNYAEKRRYLFIRVFNEKFFRLLFTSRESEGMCYFFLCEENFQKICEIYSV